MNFRTAFKSDSATVDGYRKCPVSAVGCPPAQRQQSVSAGMLLRHHKYHHPAEEPDKPFRQDRRVINQTLRITASMLKSYNQFHFLPDHHC